MKSKPKETTRRKFLGSGLAASAVFALSGPANAAASLAQDQTSSGAVLGSQDVRILCASGGTAVSGTGADNAQIVSVLDRGPNAVWIGGYDVFDSAVDLIPVTGDYQRALSVEQRTLTLHPSMTPIAIEMRPRQIQLWHIVNRAAGMTFEFQPFSEAAGFQWRQTANDDLPLVWDNFSSPSNINAAIALGPANRIDLLVQAPARPGSHSFKVVMAGKTSASVSAIVQVTPSHTDLRGASSRGVTQRVVTQEMREFPSAPALYPPTPAALLDITEIGARRAVTFTSAPGGTLGGTLGSDAPQISMPAAEEWRVSNTTQVARTLHFSGMPVQMLNVFDPATMSAPRLFGNPWPWADTIQIPAATSMPGSVTLRLRGGRREGALPYAWSQALFRYAG